jgi:iron complex outermembrane receptor protein
MGPLPLADVYAEYFDDQLSQEFQLNYDDSDRWQAVAGVYYFRGEAGGEGRSLFLVAPTFEPGSPNNPLPFATTTVATLYTGQRGTVDTTSYALYGDVTWQLSETVGLSFGARYTWEEKEVDILAQSFTDASFSQVADTETDFQDTESWSDFSPRIGLDIQLSDTALLYASVSNGFKSGGFNIRARQNIEPESTRPYDPEEVTAYELGIKSNLGERVTLNVAYFYSDYDDIQLSIFSRASDGTFFGDFTNAGEGVIQGVELEFTAAVSDALFFSGNLAYLDAEYKEFLDRGVDIADDQAFTNTPPWAATLNSHYTHTLGALGDVQALLTVSYRDEMYPTTDLSEVLKQESYTTVDASVAWTSVSAQWRVALEGRNLTDEEYRTSGYDLQASSGIDLIQGFYGSPRTYAVRLDYRF